MSTINLGILAAIQYADLDIDELRELKEELLEKVLTLADMRRKITDDMAQDILEEQMSEYMIYVHHINTWIQKFYARTGV